MSISIIPAEDICRDGLESRQEVYLCFPVTVGEKRNLQKTETTSRKKCLSWVTIWKDTGYSVGDVQQVKQSRCERRSTKELIIMSTRSSGWESGMLVISLTLLSFIQLRRRFYGPEPSTFRQGLLSWFTSLWKSPHTHAQGGISWLIPDSVNLIIEISLSEIHPLLSFYSTTSCYVQNY